MILTHDSFEYYTNGHWYNIQNYHELKSSANSPLFAISAIFFLSIMRIFLIIRNYSVRMSHVTG